MEVYYINCFATCFFHVTLCLGYLVLLVHEIYLLSFLEWLHKVFHCRGYTIFSQSSVNESLGFFSVFKILE